MRTQLHLCFFFQLEMFYWTIKHLQECAQITRIQLSKFRQMKYRLAPSTQNKTRALSSTPRPLLPFLSIPSIQSKGDRRPIDWPRLVLNFTNKEAPSTCSFLSGSFCSGSRLQDSHVLSVWVSFPIPTASGISLPTVGRF